MALDADALLSRLPTEPGVYLMKDRKGRVIYVGKAKDLRARVAQYLRGGDDRLFVASGLLAKLLADVDTFVVSNEKEALLLENNLIKQHQPRFNVKLTDDKNYIVLRIDPKARFPRVEVGRRIKDDGAKYFGPFHSATGARETLRLVNRHFQLRTCTDHVLDHRARPCILYQIKRCPAPCVLPVDPVAYGEQVEDAALFLAGKKDELVPRLRERMQAAARELEYERAAAVRDQIAAVERTLTKQVVVAKTFLDQDVVGFHRNLDVVEIALLFMRQGKLMGRRAFRLDDQEVPDEEVVRGFLRSYYESGTFVPDEVLLPLEIEDAAAFTEWLRETSASKVSLITPQRGDKVALLELARKNAEAQAASRKGQRDALAGLTKLKDRLSLGRVPRRIECFDIAHLQGSATVASMVVFVDGEPENASYRRFRVKTVQNDDFASMYEVLTRRLRRAKEGVPGWELPDLLVVDGGKGQLGTAVAAIRDLGLERQGDMGFDVIGLAKEREDAGGDTHPDRVFLRGVKDPVRLRANSAELFVLARVRDEAHRFANTYHRKLRGQRTLRSSLEDVPGVGDKRKMLLLRHFGSVKRIRAATAEELGAVPGMSKKAAAAILAFFAGADAAAGTDLPAKPAIADRSAEPATAGGLAEPEPEPELFDDDEVFPGDEDVSVDDR